MRESDVEKYLTERVRQLGGDTRKVAWIGRHGAPDRFVMLPRGCAWVELKAPGQKPRPSQEREHERLRSMGQRVEVIDSFESVEAFLA